MSSGASRPGERYVATGFKMIRSFSIENFRCYKSLRIAKCERLNLILGDNGSGKTSILEALFLAVGQSPELALRLKMARGWSGQLAGTMTNINQHLWSDLFYGGDLESAISIKLEGDKKENRGVKVVKSGSSITLPLEEGKLSLVSESSDNISFLWTDSEGNERSSTPILSQQGLKLDPVGEGSTIHSYYPTGIVPPPAEIAQRFSVLSRANRKKELIQLIRKVWPWIEDITIEVNQAPELFADLKGTASKVPLVNISSGINSLIGLLLSIINSPGGLVLYDEIGSGIYYRHLSKFWNVIIAACERYDCQLIASTHSKEVLDELFRSLGGREIAVWRCQRNDGVHTVSELSAIDAHDTLDFNSDIR